MGNPVFQAILFLIAFGCILFLAYVTTRIVGGKTGRIMQGKYISIVETVSLGVEKRLHLVKAGGKFVLIATCGKSIHFLTEVDIEEYEETVGDVKKEGALNFRKLFEKYVGNFRKNTKENDSDIINGESDVYESIKIHSFKNNLNRLKDITGETQKQSEKTRG